MRDYTPSEKRWHWNMDNLLRPTWVSTLLALRDVAIVYVVIKGALLLLT